MQLGESEVQLIFDDRWEPTQTQRQARSPNWNRKHARRKKVQTTAFTPHEGEQQPRNATIFSMAGYHPPKRFRKKIKEPRRLKLSSSQLTHVAANVTQPFNNK